MTGLIKVTDDGDPQKADFWFRIAELYADKQRFYQFQARSLDQKIFDAPPASKPTLQSQQQGYEKQEQEWLLKAVKAYIAATKFKKYERMDEVLFKLAYMLTSVKKEDQARDFFLRLIKRLPELEVHPRRVPVVRRVLFQQGRDGQRAALLREGGAVPEVQRLPVRRLQKGLVLRQPGRLQDRARDLRRRRANDPGPAGPISTARRRRRSKRKRRRTSSRRTRTSAVRTRRGSSSSAPAATSRRR